MCAYECMTELKILLKFCQGPINIQSRVKNPGVRRLKVVEEEMTVACWNHTVNSPNCRAFTGCEATLRTEEGETTGPVNSMETSCFMCRPFQGPFAQAFLESCLCWRLSVDTSSRGPLYLLNFCWRIIRFARTRRPPKRIKWPSVTFWWCCSGHCHPPYSVSF